MNRTAPSTLIAALALLVLLGVALAAGCASTPSGSTATKTPTPAAAGTTSAGTAAAVTTSGSSGSGAGALTAVSFDRLIPFIPRAAGAWTLDGEAQGMTMKDGEGRDYTWVTGEYQKAGDDNAKGSVMIQDAAVANTPFKQQWSPFKSYESTDGWYRSVTVKGQPGWKFYTKSTNDYGQWVLVGDRYIVFTTVEGGTEADIDSLVNAMDLSGLAAVK